MTRQATINEKPLIPMARGKDRSGRILQRTCACGQHTSGGGCSTCEKKRPQRSTGNAEHDTRNPGEVPLIVHEVLRSPGQPLNTSTRMFFEPRFGHDFSHVRVHTDAKAVESAREVNALAYTVGRNVVFGAGRYAPSASEGQRLLAHELTHVVQQSSTANLAADAIEIGEAGTSLEREADSSANRIMNNDPDVRTSGRQTVQHAMLQRACPPVPTGLGATPGAEPCDRGRRAVVAGSNFLFCQDSDRLTDGQTAWLASVTADARRATSVEIHGNASTEGPAADPDYNFRLACKRAAAIAAHFRSAGVTARIRLVTDGPTSGYGPAASNRNAVVVLTIPAPPPTPVPAPTPPTPAPSTPSACRPGAGIPNTVCGAYAANSWWLPLAYVHNATCACSTTPTTPEYNCIRKVLQDRLAATPATIKALGASNKALEASSNPLDFLAYQRFVVNNLTPLIYRDHVIAYASCCCTSGPAAFPAWIGVTTVPLPTCSAVGASIALAGSCHGTPGRF